MLINTLLQLVPAPTMHRVRHIRDSAVLRLQRGGETVAAKRSCESASRMARFASFQAPGSALPWLDENKIMANVASRTVARLKQQQQ
jgi:hypothetical protein